MDVINCKRCGKLFNYVSGMKICPVCKELEEQKFQTVKEYIRDNKQAGINEIAENCDVTPNEIRQWIREERLFFGDESPIGIDCEGCGAIIKSGRFCEKCKNELARGILDLTKKPEVSEPESHVGNKQNPKMRFLG